MTPAIARSARNRIGRPTASPMVFPEPINTTKKTFVLLHRNYCHILFKMLTIKHSVPVLDVVNSVNHCKLFNA